MTASAAIEACASEALDAAAADPNVKVYHLFLRAGQTDEFCRWVRQGGYRSVADAWLACVRPEWMLDLLESAGHDDAAKLRLFAVRAVRDTPIGAGRTAADIMDPGTRAALDVGERHAAGQVSDEELRLAHDLAAVVGRKRPGRQPEKRRLASTACWALACPELFDARVIASVTDKSAFSGPEAKRFQADLLRTIFGNPFAG
jgi:hypothetical protein